MIRAFQIRELLEKLAERDAGHPLAAVFQPVLLTNEETLEKRAAEYYNQIKTSHLTEKLKSILLEVFVNWVEQRLKHKGKKEIEQMFIGELPDLRETQSGKDLIAIGKAEGKAEGKIEGKAEGKIEGQQEALMLMIEKKFGTLPPELRNRVLQTTSVDKLRNLLMQLLAVDSVDELKW